MTSVDSATSPTTVGYGQRDPSRVNDKVYLQGDKALISEAGEWALEHKTGMVYYWPRDQAAMAARPSLIPSLCTPFTRAGIEWRR